MHLHAHAADAIPFETMARQPCGSACKLLHIPATEIREPESATRKGLRRRTLPVHWKACDSNQGFIVVQAYYLWSLPGLVHKPVGNRSTVT